MPQELPDSNTMTLDKVLTAVEHWRSHKKDYPGGSIPDKTWKMIFHLEENGYSGILLRRIFSLNSSQYTKKYNELMEKPISDDLHDQTAVGDPSVNFCEVTVKHTEEVAVPPLTPTVEKTKQALSQLKSPDNSPEQYLDYTTVIIECIREDGQRLKIHTTNQSLDDVMQAFFKKKVAVT